MRLIHCSDLHLDAPLITRHSDAAAAARRGELLHTLQRLFDWAAQHKTDGLLLCGDLFDTSHPSARTIRAVEDLIRIHRNLEIFYLRGNHDMGDLLFADSPDPESFHRFDDRWTTYRLSFPQGGTRSGQDSVCRDICIHGAEIPGGLRTPPITDPGDINIALLHGQIQETLRPAGPDRIPLPLLRGRNIDYLALWHIHSCRILKLDARGTAAYSGCLEGHGFDECGPCGFILLDIDVQTGQIRHRFIPFASRQLFRIPCDITGCSSVVSTSERMDETLRAAQERRDCPVRERDMVRVELTGAPSYDCSADLRYLTESFADRFYYFTITDETHPAFHIEDFLSDPTLKGEFVRTVSGAPGITAQDKEDILRCGLRALAGERVFL